MNCYECDTPLQGTESECPTCGVKLICCPNADCGLLISSSSVVCPYCGEDIDSTISSFDPAGSSKTSPKAPKDGGSLQAEVPEKLSEMDLPSDMMPIPLFSEAKPLPRTTVTPPIQSDLPILTVTEVAPILQPPSAPELSKLELMEPSIWMETRANFGTASGGFTDYCQLFFKQGKPYKVSNQTILEFQVAAVSYSIRQLDLTIQGADNFEAEVRLHDLSPGSLEDFEGVPFVPYRAGEALFSIILTVFIENGLLLRSTGRVCVVIKEKLKSINISAGRDVIGVDAGMLEMPFLDPPPRWTPVLLKPDKDLIRRMQRVLPKPITSGAFSHFLREPGKGEQPNRQFSLLDGDRDWRLLVFIGLPLSIGRSEQQTDWAIRFLGELRNQQNLLKRVSRHHCDIRLDGPLARIRNLGTRGLTINGIRIPRDVDVVLADGDMISLAEVFRFDVQLQTDEHGVAAIILHRHQDARERQTYVLLQRALDLVSAGTRLEGWLLRDGEAIYYSPKPGVSNRLNGRSVCEGTIYEWRCGNRLTNSQTALVMEEPVTCPSCGRRGMPRPDSNTCSFCAASMEMGTGPKQESIGND